MAFRLCRAGYDVWLVNSRGNKYSKGHKLDTDTVFRRNEANYWDFTWMDMAKDDLPSSFKYIYEETNKKIVYVGYSQGTITMLTALT